MATAEQVLAMMEMNAIEHPYCIIDADSRKITVPDEYKLLGVESDENVERVYFKCPKIVGDGIDLSTLGLRINYQNANSQKDSYPVDELTVENEFITFSWLLSRKAVAYKGTVKFIVCAVRTGDDGMVSNEWNTTIASAEVLEGLEVDFSSIPDEEGKDLLESLIAQSQVKLMEVGEATEEAKRSAERADTAADSAGHAADAANNAAEEARRAVEELKGNIGIDDTAPSETKTYSSKKIEAMAAVNWIPESKLKSTQDLRSESKYENGKLTVFNTQPTETNHSYTRITLSVKKNTEYTINWKSERTGKTGGGIWINGTDNSVINKEHTNELNGSFTFNTGEKEEVFILFVASVATNSGGAVGDSATFWDIMLVEGENETPYVENVRDVVKEVAKAKKRIETLENDTDISQKTVTFEMAAERAGVESGDSLAVAFGKLAKYCADLKPHVFVDPVNNLLGTDATLPLAATQGKTLDEKIEGMKSDVTELNGKTEKLQAHELCIPGDTTNAPPNNKFLNISLKDRFNAVNRCHYFRQPNGTAFEGCPTPLKAQEFIGYREVYWYSTINVMVKLIEFYPMPGRVWTNFYNNGTWTGWKSITPV